MPSLIEFHEDLRVDEQSALCHADQQSQDGIVGLTTRDTGSTRYGTVSRCFFIARLGQVTA